MKSFKFLLANGRGVYPNHSLLAKHSYSLKNSSVISPCITTRMNFSNNFNKKEQPEPIVAKSLLLNSNFSNYIDLFKNSLNNLSNNQTPLFNNNSNNNNNNKDNKDPKGPQKPPIFAIVLFVLSLLLPLYTNGSGNSQQTGPDGQQQSQQTGADGFGGPPNTITLQDFISNYLTNDLNRENIAKIVVQDKSVAIVFFKNTSNTISFSIGSIKQFESYIERYSPLTPIYYQLDQTSLMSLFGKFLPSIITLSILAWFMRGQAGGAGGAGSPLNRLSKMGKNKATVYYPENYTPPPGAPPNLHNNLRVTKFKDVAGCQESKQEIMEFVDFLKNPEHYNKLGAKIPKGCILHGPPGTGKTLLARACSSEAGTPFITISGSEFVEMFVGVGAARIRDLFKLARTLAPCIVFIDEIDAIGKKRGNNKISNGSDERENTLNQLLIEMDGFNTAEPGKEVVLMASTNRLEVLDDALLRPGRFDRKIEIDLPDLEGRKQIYMIHLKKLKLELNTDLALLAGRLASTTAGFSGADIANVCNEAALIAARFESSFVEFDHFEEAISRTIAGLQKKSRVLPPDLRKVVAYHEAGHAVCGWFLKNCDPLLKVTIVPRGSAALGYAQYIPSDNNLMTEEQYFDTMVMALGGRCSEEIHFETVTSGAQNDFQKVTAIATKMCKELGMSKKLGYINYSNDSSGGISVTKPFSETSAIILDEEIKKIVTTAHERCAKLLRDNSAAVEKVAQRLLERETITRKDMLELLGKRPYAEKHNEFEKYLDIKE
ncbi:hypothetical protein ACO0SA_003844 [Hanseniaspora valbyensis]